MTTDITGLRRNYDRAALLESELPQNPVELFAQWFNQAIDEKLPEPYAFSLATATADGAPSVRTVLLRGYGDDGFKFYTNYQSTKGKHLLENPRAQMLFFWHDLEQQIRISGSVEKLSDAESVNYFHTRPFDSQLGAWVSQPQSAVVASRDAMEADFKRLKDQYSADTAVPKPPEWGGYLLKPSRFEFWQGRPNRMHDRLVYEHNAENDTNHRDAWRIKRLYP